MKKTNYFMLVSVIVLLIIGVIVEANYFTIIALILMIFLFTYFLKKKNNEH